MNTSNMLRQSSSDITDRAMRALLSSFSPAGRRARLSIAIFHRVLPRPDPLFPDEVDSVRFDEICRWLSSWFVVLPLDEATRRLAKGDLPARALSITFDDGYADNHDEALPILRSHGLCASFFISTGYLDGGVMWNDIVVESVRRTKETRLDLAWLGLAEVSVVDVGSIEARRAAIPTLLKALKYREHNERQRLAEAVAELAQVRVPTDLMMSSAQVRALAAAGMQIGAHTVSHPILARMDDAGSRGELAQGKADLEALLSQPVTLFAYPNGRPGRDYGAREVLQARKLGFEAAVSTSPGAACQSALQPFELPRFTPWDRERWRFGLRLTRNLRTRPEFAS